MTDRADAMEAMETATDELEQLDSTTDNAAERGKREHEIVDEYIGTVAHALSDGVNDPAGFYAAPAADESDYYSKTDIKQKIKERVDSVRGDGKPALDEFVEDNLESVTILETTDQHQGAIYTWDFGSFKVETNSGEDSRGHFGFAHFRDLIFESGGENIGLPTEERRGGGDWRDFMIRMVDERGSEVKNVGPRTIAKEELANKIRRRVAYGTAEAAVDNSGVWVVTRYTTPDAWVFPDWWLPASRALTPPVNQERSLDRDDIELREIRVHESLIVPLIEESEITRSALYHELDARNLTIPGMPGTSTTEQVNGRTERFWVLRPDIATPDVYIPDPTLRCGFRHFWEMDTGTTMNPLGTRQEASADGGSVSEQDDDGADVEDGADSTTATTFDTVGGDDDE